MRTIILAAPILALTTIGTAYAQCSSGYYRSSDPAFSSLSEYDIINSLNDATEGTRISFDANALETGVFGDRSPNTNVMIHYLGSTSRYEDNCRYSRWYQWEGNTHGFRLFADEENVANSRALAARIEMFSNQAFQWNYSSSNPRYRQWTGRYHIAAPQDGAIFQSKHTGSDAWSTQIGMRADGSIRVNKRGNGTTTVLTNMTGKSFDVAVLDDGKNYKVYIRTGSSSSILTESDLVASGSWTRSGSGGNQFRWGTYVGANQSEGSLVFVTGAKFKTLPSGVSTPQL